MIFIETARSSHRKCTICNSRFNLKSIKKSDRLTAYKKFKKLIKHETRVCIKHLDESGFLKKSEYKIIPTKSKLFDKKIKQSMDEMVNHDDCESIFDKFRNIKELSNETCKEITGWSFKQFLEFSKYINLPKKTRGINYNN
jgi:hypothetical protein